MTKQRKPPRRRRILWSLLAVLGIAFVAIQFKRPVRTNPPVDSGLTLTGVASPPPEVKQMLTESCADCHSHETRWPWYSSIAPVSWWVADDVRHGREHFNMSLFGEEDRADQAALLLEAAEEVRSETMPLKSYALMHQGARLSKEQRKRIAVWLEEAARAIGARPSEEPSKSAGQEHDHKKHEHR